ncbi:MAG TPA: tryptophan synthase subunit alpha [Bacteroidota bacterium]|nr:tryptophan synthase subunit alpha [Bacteroidota bacterium]
MNRIQKKFEQLHTTGKKAIVPYITPEFPFKGITLDLLRACKEAGADMVEVGIPFSDPLADGPTIQHSSHVALSNGVTMSSILDIVREFRRQSEIPIILMGYVNPMFRRGYERFTAEASSAGVDGLIVPDLPPEEGFELKKACESAGLSIVFLIAPTTPDERMKRIDLLSTDFTYCVSVTGVTGSRESIGTNGSLDRFLQRVRLNVKKPFVVGFGISNSDQVRNVCRYADGAVVGSALIDAIGKAHNPAEAIDHTKRFLLSLSPS